MIYLKHAHPSSDRTFTAIRFAALAIPDLVPPAVPLSLSQRALASGYRIDEYSRHMRAVTVTIYLLFSGEQINPGMGRRVLTAQP